MSKSKNRGQVWDLRQGPSPTILNPTPNHGLQTVPPPHTHTLTDTSYTHIHTHTHTHTHTPEERDCRKENLPQQESWSQNTASLWSARQEQRHNPCFIETLHENQTHTLKHKDTHSVCHGWLPRGSRGHLLSGKGRLPVQNYQRISISVNKNLSFHTWRSLIFNCKKTDLHAVCTVHKRDNVWLSNNQNRQCGVKHHFLWYNSDTFIDGADKCLTVSRNIKGALHQFCIWSSVYTSWGVLVSLSK